MVEQKRDSSRPTIRRVGMYAAVFMLAFAATLYWTFPYSVVSDRLIGEVEEALGMNVQIRKLSPHFGLGLKATDVVASSPDRDGPRIEVESVTARLRLLEAITSGPAVSFDVRGELGRISGTARRSRDDTVGLELNVEDLSLGAIPGLEESLGIGFLGDASGTMDVSLPEGSIEKMSGVVDLRVTGGGLSGGTIGAGRTRAHGGGETMFDMLRGATIPPIDFGQMAARVVAEAGTLRFDPALTVSSEDLEAEISGSIQLRGNVATSRTDLAIRIKPTDKFWEENQMLAGLAQAMMRNAQQSDGFYAYRLSGAIARPNLQPGR